MRVIILCAGMGTRMVTMSSQFHKTLIPINGNPLIERHIQYLKSKGIDDITVILGHRAEDFFYLKKKYGIEYRVSDLYQTHNNYSSMLLAIDKLSDCIVAEGDLYITEDYIDYIDRNRNQYFVRATRPDRKEWGVLVDKDGRILELSNDSTGKDWELLGLSYWTGKDSHILKEELLLSGKNDYWDNSVGRIIDKISVYVTPVKEEFFFEFDSVEDILKCGLIENEQIAALCADNGLFEKINEKNYKLMKNGERYHLFVNNNKIKMEKYD